MNTKIIFATAGYEHFTTQLLKSHRYKHLLGTWPVERKEFPDGEIYHRFKNELYAVHDRDVVVIGGTHNDTATLELFDICYHLAKEGVRTITIFVPYFGYSTMERSVKNGEIVKAKTRAALLSSIPPTMRNRIVFLDLHSEGIPNYIEGSMQAVHLYAKPIIINMCRNVGGSDFVLGSTDAGRAKWVESLANDMGVQCAIITKRRVSGTETEIVGINADVKDRIVVIYDDMIRTGGSLMGAAEAYLKAGAREVHAVATHGVLPKGAMEKMMKSKVLSSISVTNSHPTAIQLSDLVSTRKLAASMLHSEHKGWRDKGIEISESDVATQLAEKEFIKVYDISSLIFDFLISDVKYS